MQETDPDSQAEPTPQTLQQEQSHEVLKLQRMKCIQNKNSLYKFKMLCTILLLLKEGEEVEVEHLVKVLHQEEVWVEDVARRPSGLQTALPANQYIPNFIWNDTESDGDYRSINIPFIGVEGLREKMPLDAELIEYFSKYFTD